MYGKKPGHKKQDALKWIESKSFTSYQELFFDYCIEVDDFDFLFKDDKLMEYLRRYRFKKDFGITSYGNNYDTLPGIWIDALEIMDNNFKDAVRVKNGS